MPKELIATRTECDTDANEHVLEQRVDSIYVAWGRDDALTSDAPDVVQVTIRQERRDEATYARYQRAECLADHRVTDAHELYSAGLTRREINNLIRVLRKARDQVFGTDA